MTRLKNGQLPKCISVPEGRGGNLRSTVSGFQSVTSVIYRSKALLSVCAEMVLLWHSDKEETIQQKHEKGII